MTDDPCRIRRYRLLSSLCAFCGCYELVSYHTPVFFRCQLCFYGVSIRKTYISDSQQTLGIAISDLEKFVLCQIGSGKEGLDFWNTAPGTVGSHQNFICTVGADHRFRFGRGQPLFVEERDIKINIFPTSVSRTSSAPWLAPKWASTIFRSGKSRMMLEVRSGYALRLSG